jgi:hypothetical protein
MEYNVVILFYKHNQFLVTITREGGGGNCVQRGREGEGNCVQGGREGGVELRVEWEGGVGNCNKSLSSTCNVELCGVL